MEYLLVPLHGHKHLLFFPHTLHYAYVEDIHDTSLIQSLAGEEHLKTDIATRLVDHAAATAARLPFALNINLTPYCNLNCIYCFARGGDYGTIRTPMDRSFVGRIVETIQQNLPSDSPEPREVRLEYFGGEPLLNAPLFMEINDAVDNAFQGKHLSLIKRISTNMSVCNNEILDFFSRNDCIVSISIDGCRAVQDAQRPFKNGKGSFDVIVNNVQKLRAVNPRLILVARMTYFSEHVDLLQNIIDLMNLDVFDFVSIYPALNSWSTVTEARKERILSRIATVVDTYPILRADFPRLRGILEFDQIIGQILCQKASLHHCRAGTAYFTLSPDGTFVPCHRLAGNDSFAKDRIGHLEEWHKTVLDITVCGTCWARYLCGGGCRQENYIETNDINRPGKNVCLYQKRLITSLLQCLDKVNKDEYSAKLHLLGRLFTYCGRQIA